MKEKINQDKEKKINLIAFIIVLIIISLIYILFYFNYKTYIHNQNYAKEIIIQEYKIENKNLDVLKLEKILKTEDFSEIGSILGKTKKLPKSFSFEAKYIRESTYDNFSELFKPLCYDIHINKKYVPYRGNVYEITLKRND